MSSPTKPFGIAGVQSAVVPWDPEATFEKMAGVTRRIAKGFPWVDMVLFHELAASGLVQFDKPPTPEQWAAVRSPIPGPITDRLCELASSTGLWLVPGSLYEADGDTLYNTAVAISPQVEVVA